MMSDARKAARLLIEAYGGDAAAVAEKRAANLKEDSIESAATTWRRIAKAVKMLEGENAQSRQDSMASPGF